MESIIFVKEITITFSIPIIIRFSEKIFLILLGNRCNKSREPGDFMNNSIKKEIVFTEH